MKMLKLQHNATIAIKWETISFVKSKIWRFVFSGGSFDVSESNFLWQILKFEINHF